MGYAQVAMVLTKGREDLANHMRNKLAVLRVNVGFYGISKLEGRRDWVPESLPAMLPLK